MDRRFANDWLRDVLEKGRARTVRSRGPSFSGSETLLLDTMFSLRADDFEHIIGPIQDFQGTKLMVSCTDRTPLKKVLKQALCLADLVIIVPAPLWVSCVSPGSVQYASFNFESIELASGWNVAPGLLKNLSGLLVEEYPAFDDGAVTFLPQVGETLQRWSHPELALPELPAGHLGNQCRSTSLDVHLNAFYGLCSERLAAERLGAMHLNSASFTVPVFGDLTIGKRTKGGQWVRSLIELGIPDLSTLSLGDVLRLRHELPDVCSQLSREIQNALRLQAEYGKTAESEIADLRVSVANLTRQMEFVLLRDCFGNIGHLPKTPLMLGSGGPNGGTMSTADFLLEGGSLRDLVHVITATEEGRLQIREDSIFATAMIGQAGRYS